MLDISDLARRISYDIIYFYFINSLRVFKILSTGFVRADTGFVRIESGYCPRGSGEGT